MGHEKPQKRDNVQLFGTVLTKFREPAMRSGTSRLFNTMYRKSNNSVYGYIKIKNITQMDMWVYEVHRQDSRV
jgi:hypothetical protein